MVGIVDPFSEQDDLRAEVSETLATLAQVAPLERNPDYVSLDVLFPYLFSSIPRERKAELSLLLGAYRALICAYLGGRGATEPIKTILRAASITPIGEEDYRRLNALRRSSLKGTLPQSYLASTHRVFYRRKLLRANSGIIDAEVQSTTLAAVDILSAFFLFDDDVIDLEEDMETGKATLLSEYVLRRGGTVEAAISEMLGQLRQLARQHESDDYLIRFIEMISEIYRRALGGEPSERRS